ncbi:MAG TPA: VOC family protein [Patescibacteria group bacterium]|nr:VOC family protein [Patescibacteria group bacterium]
MQKITPFLWFDTQAREAAKFYTTVFKDAKLKSPQTIDDTPSGTVDIISIELFGQEFTLMSAGPQFKFTEAISFVINCDGQEEVDYYWEKLTSDGGEESQCGWLKDKFGVSWQVVPKQLTECLSNPDPKKSQAAMQAMLKMKKIMIADLQKASSEA